MDVELKFSQTKLGLTNLLFLDPDWQIWCRKNQSMSMRNRSTENQTIFFFFFDPKTKPSLNSYRYNICSRSFLNRSNHRIILKMHNRYIPSLGHKGRERERVIDFKVTVKQPENKLSEELPQAIRTDWWTSADIASQTETHGSVDQANPGWNSSTCWVLSHHHYHRQQAPSDSPTYSPAQSHWFSYPPPLVSAWTAAYGQMSSALVALTVEALRGVPGIFALPF